MSRGPDSPSLFTPWHVRFVSKQITSNPYIQNAHIGAAPPFSGWGNPPWRIGEHCHGAKPLCREASRAPGPLARSARGMSSSCQMTRC